MVRPRVLAFLVGDLDIVFRGFEQTRTCIGPLQNAWTINPRDSRGKRLVSYFTISK